MYKLLQSVRKEALLLSRDLGGLIILFVMPLILIITITLIQDGAYRNLTQQRIAIAIADNDQGFLTQNIQESLQQSGFFDIYTQHNGIALNEQTAREQVLSGNYLMAIVIPPNLSADLQNQVNQKVQQIVSIFSGEETPIGVTESVTKEIKLYFDPTVQLSFKENIKNAIDKMMYRIENKLIYQAFEEELGTENPLSEQSQLITFTEINPKAVNDSQLPNSVQHNVPAWTLFAIFFIVIPLSTNIVKEKTQGTALRLFTSPLSYGMLITAKAITFLIISILQFGLMVAVGIYIFPLLGLAQLDIEGKTLLLTLVATASGLAAIGIGILLGTFSQTQEQSAPVGATLTVILAAIGGVWIPTFAMPAFMQTISNISPMNWGLQAFYDILLREGSLLAIAPKIGLLFAFTIICILIAISYEKRKRNR
ncbi:ABC transporter permease [Capnocytophaga sp.]|uniref:ABC transporter permease n=1 Tax=Capnocytophaga sp. TaxID=44737 RepID=UPI0026DDBC2B|nr:ABC transporter permease [Capnocytophaga sp.]MDO5105330.1 ABC transporter permease [Capnocytophaga sp.]